MKINEIKVGQFFTTKLSKDQFIWVKDSDSMFYCALEKNMGKWEPNKCSKRNMYDCKAYHADNFLLVDLEAKVKQLTFGEVKEGESFKQCNKTYLKILPLSVLDNKYNVVRLGDLDTLGFMMNEDVIDEILP